MFDFYTVLFMIFAVLDALKSKTVHISILSICWACSVSLLLCIFWHSLLKWTGFCCIHPDPPLCIEIDCYSYCYCCFWKCLKRWLGAVIDDVESLSRMLAGFTVEQVKSEWFTIKHANGPEATARRKGHSKQGCKKPTRN